MKGTNRRLRLCSDCGGRGVKVKFVVEKEKSWEHRLENGCSFFECAPGGARFQRVQVPNPPGSGKDIAEGKGVHREVESEGSWM